MFLIYTTAYFTHEHFLNFSYFLKRINKSLVNFIKFYYICKCIIIMHISLIIIKELIFFFNIYFFYNSFYYSWLLMFSFFHNSYFFIQFVSINITLNTIFKFIYILYGKKFYILWMKIYITNFTLNEWLLLFLEKKKFTKFLTLVRFCR